MTKTMALLLLLTVLVFLLYPRRRAWLEQCEALFRQLPGNQLEDLERFADPRMRDEDADFWVASHGLAGAWARLRHMVTFVRIIQSYHHQNQINAKDAAYIWKRAALQTWFTLWSLPEAVLSHFVPEMPHIASRMALGYHRELILRTITLCSVEGAPECMANLKDIL